MRQLVLVEEASAGDAAGLARKIAAAGLPDLPVVVYAPADSGPGATVARVDAPPQGAVHFTVFEDVAGRRIVVADHHDGQFPKDIGAATRQAFTACDTLVIRCPAVFFLTAMQAYDPLLFTIPGLLDRNQVLNSTAYLTSTVDHFRNLAARRRHEADFTDEPPALPLDVLRGETAVITNVAFDEAVRESVVLQTLGDRLPDEAARAGFRYHREKVRVTERSLDILQGEAGIALFGPYIELDPGRYRFRLALRCPDAGARFVLEAAWGEGSTILASDLYPFDGQISQAIAILEFEIDGAAAGQAVEFRLWNDAASAEFRLTGLSLTRLIP